jgi:hypothetical protein
MCSHTLSVFFSKAAFCACLATERIFFSFTLPLGGECAIILSYFKAPLRQDDGAFLMFSIEFLTLSKWVKRKGKTFPLFPCLT